MSIESAKAYLARMKTDEEFRKKVNACKDVSEKAAFIKAEGFDFTNGDINVVTAVLDDSELQKVAGGVGYNRSALTAGSSKVNDSTPPCA